MVEVRSESRVPGSSYVDLAKGNIVSNFMKIVRADDKNLSNFEKVVDFLRCHTYEIVRYVRNSEHLMLDDGHTLVNCPPPAEEGDDHGGLLIKTYSELVDQDRIVYSRQFEVHELGNLYAGQHRIEIRSRIYRNGVVSSEDNRTVEIDI
ncbi:hypothetical protein Zmor_011899 [Zophobas morio]|jgi:hypothetical protein|uniref:Uncharacterized protein n=1 Tax=Zophobas morio TaxID=2755281 RepID=A0AA38HHW9_9CUCU|nr:hypothetical protein Zmor_011899 [Zophobas morio]